MSEWASRAELIVRRMESRLQDVCAAVPPICPPPQFWLDSDAGPSYCRECAEAARAAEMGLERWPEKPDKFTWDYSAEDQAAADLIDVLKEGIDGGFDTISDSTAACKTCGRTLSYILTDEGVESEVEYYRECPNGGMG